MQCMHTSIKHVIQYVKLLIMKDPLSKYAVFAELNSIPNPRNCQQTRHIPKTQKMCCNHLHTSRLAVVWQGKTCDWHLFDSPPILDPAFFALFWVLEFFRNSVFWLFFALKVNVFICIDGSSCIIQYLLQPTRLIVIHFLSIACHKHSIGSASRHRLPPCGTLQIPVWHTSSTSVLLLSD
jgi:hypothetical protein